LPASADIVVADAGPLIAMARIDCVRLLPAPFARVLTVPAVIAEISAGAGCPETAPIEAAIAAGSVELAVPPAGDAGRGLGPGETGALHLALERRCALLLDDRAARRVAAALGLPVIGVLGTLVLLKRAGQIALVRPLAEQLVDSGYYLSGTVVAEACRLAGE
jgi:uncharacterized protein